MKNILIIVLCLWSITVWGKEEKVKRIRYCTTLEEAMQQAARKHKPIFFNCYVDWAGASVLMDSIVLSEPELKDFIEKHFVSLRVDMVKTEEGRKLAGQYGVKFYAHFLILDEKGEVQHRIVGGAKAPEFLEKLKQGLNPKTSLAGMTRCYEKGDRRLKFLAAYADVLALADENEKYREVTDYYLRHVDSTDMYLPQTWKILARRGWRYESEWFNFIYAHKDELMRKNGQEVTKFIVQSAFDKLYPFLLLEEPYNETIVGGIVQKINDLDTNSMTRRQLLAMCQIVDLRHGKKYPEMMDVWEKTVPGLSSEFLKWKLDITLGRLQDMGEPEKKRAVVYLEDQMEGMIGTKLSQYTQAVQELTDYRGILFETGSLQEALDKARKEKKAVFVDCFTT
ncbi:MAG: thioredoxin family protein, partial [Odoribacter sp.]|nr:thioredoxin family protein [Odoribacter sp.]